jgi:zona occludens toxin (predicted ATPase)
MKISAIIIQNRNIKSYSSDLFDATYKGKRIYITTDHGFGKPKYDHLKRYCIDVWDIKSGMKDVDAWQDFHEMKDAIRFALIGACLIPDNGRYKLTD